MLLLQDIHLRHPDGDAIGLAELHVGAGESCLLTGPSGSGKSTLLRIAAGLLQPDRGSVVVAGQALAALAGRMRDRFRGRHVGLVHQHLHLVPSLTVLQNLLAAQYCAGLALDAARAQAVLATLGLAAKAGAYPETLSGGQAQRVAIARAVVNGPALILADEPTASLDDHNAAAVLALLQEQAAQHRASLVIATHDARAKAVIPRQHALAAGA